MTHLTGRPTVCLITEGTLTPSNFRIEKGHLLDLVQAAANSNIPLVQIREKSLTASQLSELCLAAYEIGRGSRTRVLLNDRADVALAAGIDGVHLPANGLPAAAIRKNFPDDFIIGVSAHSIDDVVAAREAGADYAFFSPVFETPGKEPAVGLESLRACVAAAEEFPVIALGGINASNYRSVLDAGASGFAAIRYLNDASVLKAVGADLFEHINE